MTLNGIPLEGSLLAELQRLAKERKLPLERLAAKLLQEALGAHRSAAGRSEPELELYWHRKTRFLSGLVHELRTPLGSMLMLAELLADNPSGGLSPKEIQYAENIHRATSEVLALISDVGLLNRIEAGRVEVLPSEMTLAPFAEAIAKAFRPLAEERGLALDVELTQGLPESVSTDRQQLRRIVDELVGNALRVTERGGVTVRLGRTSDRLTLTVRDTGATISEEDLETLFEPFAQPSARSGRKHGGSGLELAVARALARLLGGELWASNEGGTFVTTLELPLDSAPGAAESVGPGSP